MNSAKSAVTAFGTRPYLRSRIAGVVTAVSVTITVAAVAFSYKSTAFNDNEEEQRTRKAPNAYVSVDRSGGGV